MSGILKDFNLIIPEVRIAKLGDQEIDVSKIPSRLSLEIAIYRDQIWNNKIKSAEEAWRKSVESVAKICQVSNPTVTSDWLIDNTHYEQLLEFIDFVLEPINNPGKKKLNQDNPEK